jgi:hypothetical protein
MPLPQFYNNISNFYCQHFYGPSYKPNDMRLLFPGLLLLFLSPARPVVAQDDLLPASRFLTSIPFKVLDGGIIIGRARIGSFADSLNFIFDTGCGGISLDSSTAEQHRLCPRTSDQFIHGIGGVRPQRLLDALTIHLPGLSLDSMVVQVSDYEVLSSIYGEKIDGIIGYGFFSRYLVSVDYDSSKMFVYEKGAITYPKGGFLLRPRLFRLPTLEGRLNDARAIQGRFYFDTGAGLCLLLSSDFSSDSVVFGPKRKKPVKTEAAGLGGRTNMRLTTLKTFSLGPFHFRQIPTYIFDDSYDVTNYPELSGLIGNDLLRRFNLILNYDRSEIYILPNSSFHQPFDYSYSGISLARLQGRIIVTGVMEESPAERAGLREGDIVLAVNGDTRQDMQHYQSALRTLGPRVKIRVRRSDGKDEELFLKVRSIL